MTGHAETAAKRIINIWRQTPRLDEWTDYLTPLNPHRIDAVINHLRTTVDGALTIARFHHAYQTDLADERRALHPGQATCPNCRLPDNSNHTPACPNRPIPFGEYMNRLVARANRGDLEATDEIVRWERFYGKTEP